jgi:hypothetical protein
MRICTYSCMATSRRSASSPAPTGASCWSTATGSSAQWPTLRTCSRTPCWPPGTGLKSFQGQGSLSADYQAAFLPRRVDRRSDRRCTVGGVVPQRKCAEGRASGPHVSPSNLDRGDEGREGARHLARTHHTPSGRAAPACRDVRADQSVHPSAPKRAGQRQPVTPGPGMAPSSGAPRYGGRSG